MGKYVVGFITDCSSILLIKKLRPEWQKGDFNGIGGQEKKGETSVEAMIRETKEETNLDIKDWTLIDKKEGESFELRVFYAMVDKKTILSRETKTDEKLSVFNVGQLPPNLAHDVERYVREIVIHEGNRRGLA